MKKILGIILVASLLLISGCASSRIDKSIIEVARHCPEERPQMCTMQYDPVCGLHADGSSKTYSSGCTACSHAEVLGYNPGECN